MCGILLSILLVIAVDLAASDDQSESIQKTPYHVSTDDTSGPQQATTIAEPSQQIAVVRLTVPYAFSHLNSEVDGARLKCWLYSGSSPPGPPSSVGADLVGFGEAFIKIHDKDTVGEAEIIISPGTDKWMGVKGWLYHDLAQAHSYLCSINLIYSGEKTMFPSIEGHDYSIPLPAWSIAKPESTLRVNGLLNQ